MKHDISTKTVIIRPPPHCTYPIQYSKTIRYDATLRGAKGVTPIISLTRHTAHANT